MGAFFTPRNWRDGHWFAVPRKCCYCKQTLWGRGSIGYVYWSYDTEVYRAHTECRTLEVLGGED